jgi:multidrug efflux pump subunit AcrA (membrane-fusion protein)
MRGDGLSGRGALPLALLVLLSVAAACGVAGGEDEFGDGSGAPGEEVAVRTVEAVQARRGGLPLRERLTGTVRATGQVVIYPQVSGPIVEVLAQNGDYVERGEPLVRIRPRISQSQLEQARANLEVSRAEAQRAKANLEELEARFERTLMLAEDSLVSAETVDTERAQLDAARATYSQAQAQVRRAVAWASGTRRSGCRSTGRPHCSPWGASIECGSRCLSRRRCWGGCARGSGWRSGPRASPTR